MYMRCRFAGHACNRADRFVVRQLERSLTDGGGMLAVLTYARFCSLGRSNQ